MILAANWKMNFTRSEAKEFLKALGPALQALPSAKFSTSHEMRLYVPYLSLETTFNAVEKINSATSYKIQVGAQNVHQEKSGAYTGEISAPMLKDLGIKHVLIGHSERRIYFHETHEILLKKVMTALEHSLQVLFCVGETLEERNRQQTQAVLAQQLKHCLSSPELKPHWGKSIHLAYEPVWAIGTGVTATPEQAQESHKYIQSLLSKDLEPTQASSVKILYGGSVQPNNIDALLSQPNINGGLVGGASLKVDSWASLWNTMLTLRNKNA